MGIVSFTKSYIGGAIMNGIKSLLPICCGVSQSAFDSQHGGKYGVTVRGYDPDGNIINPSINAWLQDKIDLSIESNWQPVINMGSGLADDLTRFVSGGNALMSSMMTRSKWVGTTPVTMSLKLRFEAVDDVKKEVIMPCHMLQSLVCPSLGAGNFLLLPPGPNPFYNEGLSQFTLLGNVQPFGNGYRTEIQIGNGFLEFSSVIIKNVKITFESRMSQDGPIGAVADITFETYEVLTKDKLGEVYGIFSGSPKSSLLSQMKSQISSAVSSVYPRL